jgi:hypothetical protein
LARPGPARTAEDPAEIRFADVEPFPLERGADVGQGGPLATECAGPVGDGIPFRGGLATGPGGGAERVDIGFTSAVADDRSNGTDMKMKPLGDVVGGSGIVEVSPTDLGVTLGWEIRLLEQAREFWGASQGGCVPNRQGVSPRGTSWEPCGPRVGEACRAGKGRK